MLGQSLFYQCLVFRCQSLIIQLHRTTYKQLPLMNRQ